MEHIRYAMLRIDLDRLNTTVEDFIEVLEQRCKRLCYCYEGKEGFNPHLHFYLHKIRSAIVTIRKDCYEAGLKGNGGYSLKQTTENPIEYLAYMMKQKRFHQHTLSTSVYESAKQHQEKVVAELKTKADKKRPVWKVILEDYYPRTKEYKEEFLEQYSSGMSNYDYDTQIKVAILLYHKEKQILIRKFQMMAIFDTIKFSLCPLLAGLELFNP